MTISNQNIVWRKPDDWPENEDGQWSDSVIVITNKGRVYYPIECMNGYWRRPSYFEKQEYVVLWAEYPSQLITDSTRN